MKLYDFDFELPLELIAQIPSAERDRSKLIVESDSFRMVGGGVSRYKISEFTNIIDYLNPGDLMIFNDSRVINAKLTLTKSYKNINVNLNKTSDRANSWRAFARPSKKLSIGDDFFLGNHKIIITNKFDYGEIEVTFVLDKIDIFSFLDQYGEIPLPAYIKRSEINDDDIMRYQNVYSRVKGSVAAPTAGLHFTNALLNKIREKNIEIKFVTLHVGAGTFMPVKTENICEHKMHSEYCEITKEVADAINQAKREKRRIISVGTTAMRTIESFASDGIIAHGFKETDIFITPGYKFQIADSLITNFHLPKSTLFMLVCAFSGMNEMKNLYKYAISNKMRFFSYGDAMMIEKKV